MDNETVAQTTFCSSSRTVYLHETTSCSSSPLWTPYKSCKFCRQQCYRQIATPTYIICPVAASLHQLEDGSSTHSPVGALCGANFGANSNIDEAEPAPLGLKDGFTVCREFSQRPVRLNNDQTHSYYLLEKCCSKALFSSPL